jgi:hypothetical protein
LGDVTMETVEQKVPKGIAVLKCKGSMEGKWNNLNYIHFVKWKEMRLN